MRINRGDEIAGLDAFRLRNALRHCSPLGFHPDRLAWLYEKTEDPQRVKEITDALLGAGLIEGAREWAHDTEYKPTLLGNALRMASAAPPVRRETAKKALDGLVARAEEVNADPDLVCWVDQIAVFGSYLDERVDRVGDVDAAITVTRRYQGDELDERCKQRRRAAQEAGRVFRSDLEWLAWPDQEIWFRLKKGSRVLSLHSSDDAILDDVQSVVVYRRQAST